MTLPSDVNIARDGCVTRAGRIVGWVDRHQQKSGRWRAVHEGGRSKDRFQSRGEAVIWLVES